MYFEPLIEFLFSRLFSVYNRSAFVIEKETCHVNVSKTQSLQIIGYTLTKYSEL